MRPPDLVVFSGLPGSGKSELARMLADRTRSTYLRVDTVEAAIVTTLQPYADNPVGYVATEWVAQDQLHGGRDVVVDAVNNVEIARQAWRDLARRTGSRLHFVEVVCSDPVEHRRRVEGRAPAWPGQGVPTWDQVVRRHWEPFTDRRLLVDNLGDPRVHVAAIVRHVCGDRVPGS